MQEQARIGTKKSIMERRGGWGVLKVAPQVIAPSPSVTFHFWNQHHGTYGSLRRRIRERIKNSENEEKRQRGEGSKCSLKKVAPAVLPRRSGFRERGVKVCSVHAKRVSRSSDSIAAEESRVKGKRRTRRRKSKTTTRRGVTSRGQFLGQLLITYLISERPG